MRVWRGLGVAEEEEDLGVAEEEEEEEEDQPVRNFYQRVQTSHPRYPPIDALFRQLLHLLIWMRPPQVHRQHLQRLQNYFY